jgi:hypothetical protein
MSAKDGWLVILKPLQVHAVKWYHHYLQHPGHTRLEEMMNTAIYWKGMRATSFKREEVDHHNYNKSILLINKQRHFTATAQRLSHHPLPCNIVWYQRGS